MEQVINEKSNMIEKSVFLHAMYQCPIFRAIVKSTDIDNFSERPRVGLIFAIGYRLKLIINTLALFQQTR